MLFVTEYVLINRHGKSICQYSRFPTIYMRKPYLQDVVWRTDMDLKYFEMDELILSLLIYQWLNPGGTARSAALILNQVEYFQDSTILTYGDNCFVCAVVNSAMIRRLRPWMQVTLRKQWAIFGGAISLIWLQQHLNT